MGFRDGFSREEGANERTGKGVACAYGIRHLHLGGVQERHAAFVEDIAAVYAAGEDEHLEVVFLDEETAFLLQGQAGQVEQPGHHHQLFVVDFQDVATAERGLQHFLVVEVLAQVDVEHLEAILGHGVQEQADALPRDGAALGQGTEAHGPALAGQVGQFLGVRDVVPGYARLNLVLRNAAAVQAYLHGAGRVFHAVQVVGQMMLLQGFHNFLAQLVLADSTHGKTFQAELAGMISEVGGCAPQLLSLGKHIPQRFPDTYNEFTHNYLPTLLR